MDPLTIGAGIAAISKLLDKIIPDKTAANTAKLELLRLEAEGDIQLAVGQQEINKIEAANPSIFVSGWRPAVGWVSVIGVCWNVIGQPFFAWVSGMVEIPVPPQADIELLLFLLGTLLGVSGLRTAEKIKGVAS
jgi:hypothetical protein